VGDGTNSVSLLLLRNYTAASNLGSETGGATGSVVTGPPMSNSPFLTVTLPQ
jgi:hypothetical protein